MKIQSARKNNHRRVFELDTPRGTYLFPYAKAEPVPTPADPIVSMVIDPELGEEAITYRLASGAEGFVHVHQVFDYNRDPEYLRDLLLYRLTLEAKRRVSESGLAHREIIRRLNTSPAQLYRLLDTTNYGKSTDSVIALLTVLGCEVDVTIDGRPAGARPAGKEAPVEAPASG